MADGKIYITISDKRLDSGTGTSSVSSGRGSSGSSGGSRSIAGSSDDKDFYELLGRYAEHQLFHSFKSLVTQSVNFSLNNIGNFTGDYITQRQVNVLRQAASGVVSVGLSTIAGARFGPAGALVGFGVGMTSLVAGTIFEHKATQVEVAKTNYSIAQLRDRVGLNTIYEGSRGTEN